MSVTITNQATSLKIAWTTKEDIIPKAGLRIKVSGDYVSLIPAASANENLAHAAVIKLLYTDVTPLAASASALADVIQGYIDQLGAQSTPVVLVTDSDIGAVDDTWVDNGAEIDCRGYSSIGLYVNFTVSDSTGNQLQVLSKHTSAGADEYVLETASDYQKTIGDASIKILYEFDVTEIPYIQIQTKATVVGATEGVVTIVYVLA